MKNVFPHAHRAQHHVQTRVQWLKANPYNDETALSARESPFSDEDCHASVNDDFMYAASRPVAGAEHDSCSLCCWCFNSPFPGRNFTYAYNNGKFVKVYEYDPVTGLVVRAFGRNDRAVFMSYTTQHTYGVMEFDGFRKAQTFIGNHGLYTLFGRGRVCDRRCCVVNVTSRCLL